MENREIERVLTVSTMFAIFRKTPEFQRHQSCYYQFGCKNVNATQRNLKKTI